MADVLRLANAAQTTTVNLYDGTLELREGSWSTQTASLQGNYTYSSFGPEAQFSYYDPVMEIMDLVGNDTIANLRSACTDIVEMLEAARRYHNDPIHTVKSSAIYGFGYSGDHRWIEWNTDGETAKRSLIYEGRLNILQGLGLSPLLKDGKMLANLTITRHPLWERITYTDMTTSQLSTLGGKYEISSIPGDVPARIRWCVLDSGTGHSNTRAWVGIRRKCHGSSDFEPLWECEDGTNYNGASDAADATASGGNKVQKASVASSSTCYWGMTVKQVCDANSHSSYLHHAGRYQVLLRAKVNSGTVGLEMRTGFSGDYTSGSLIPGELVFFSSTAWQLVEMGIFQIPAPGSDDFHDSPYLRDAALFIYAEQISGTSTLDLDCIILIPTEHYAQVNNCRIAGTTPSEYTVYIITTPDERQIAYTAYDSRPYTTGIEPTLDNFYLPEGDSVLVTAATSTTQSDLSETMSVFFRYYPRYLMYT